VDAKVKYKIRQALKKLRTNGKKLTKKELNDCIMDIAKFYMREDREYLEKLTQKDNENWKPKYQDIKSIKDILGGEG
jgi:hypothetical protein